MTTALVDVWSVTIPAWSTTAWSRLSRADAEEAQQYRTPTAAARFAVGRALVTTALSLSFPTATIKRRCSTCGSDRHGRPSVTGARVFVSSSRSRDRAIVAITQHGPIGADLARRASTRERLDLQGAILTDEELLAVSDAQDPDATFSRMWAAKEALTKCLGTGVDSDLRRVDGRGPTCAVEDASGRRHALRLAFSERFRPDALAVAVEDADRIAINHRTVPGAEPL